MGKKKAAPAIEAAKQPETVPAEPVVSKPAVKPAALTEGTGGRLQAMHDRRANNG